MIAGTGIDLIEIERIARAMEHPRFLTRFFSEDEYRYFEKRRFSPAVVAANFAGKEAVSKALGTGFRGFALKEVQILRNSFGRPYISLLGAAALLARQKGVGRLFISLTHTKETAGAFVIAEALEEAEELQIRGENF